MKHLQVPQETLLLTQGCKTSNILNQLGKECKKDQNIVQLMPFFSRFLVHYYGLFINA